jgi:pimeloyl-ACP methyl ester carboxylesterase
MKITVRELTFEVSVAGPSSGEPVLLLHGFPQNRHEWDQVVPRLHAVGLRTIAFDQRGYSVGARPSDPAAYAIDECALDAVAVLNELGYDSAHLIGHDWGAICGWHVALKHPKAVRTYTAVSVPHPLAMAEGLQTEDQRQRSAYIKLFRDVDRAAESLLADDARRLRALFAGVPDPSVYIDPLLEPGALIGPLNWYKALNPADSLGLGHATVPTTFVWSDGDVAIGPVAAHACGKYVDADYRFVALSDVSHWIPDEAPAELSDAILARLLPS